MFACHMRRYYYKHLYNQLKRSAHCFHSMLSDADCCRRCIFMCTLYVLSSLWHIMVFLLRHTVVCGSRRSAFGISIVPKSVIILINFYIYKHHIKTHLCRLSITLSRSLYLHFSLNLLRKIHFSPSNIHSHTCRFL